MNLDLAMNISKIEIIGLCSSIFFEEAYYNYGAECLKDEFSKEKDSFIKKEEEYWKKGQLGKKNSNIKNLDGEEPYLRSPKTCSKVVVECYGIYTEDSFDFLSGRLDMDKLKTRLKGKPGIFLCPERIIDIYPTLMNLDNKLMRPLPLFQNPSLVNLKMILLHELGHHLFPLHRKGTGKFISEGFANYFCFSKLDNLEQMWLLYKTWCLQPPEYSSYRILELINKNFNKEFIQVINEAYKGNISGWDKILDSSKWLDIIERQSEYTTMAMTLDFLPAYGFRNELNQYFGNTILSRWPIDNGILHMHHRHINKNGASRQVLADLLWDFYNGNSMFPWVFIPNIPNEIWSSWGMSTSHSEKGMDSNPPNKLSWPQGPLYRATKKEDWVKIKNEGRYEWAREAADYWLNKVP